MISKLSQHIAAGLARSSVIQDEDIELYAYGFYVLISKLLFLIISLILGVILNIVLESLVFYVSFSIIRAYAGGVHADKEWKCFVYTTIALLICALGIKVLINLKPTVLFAVILMISSLIIIIISPLDTKEKPLSAKEKEKYYMITAIVLLSYMLAILLLAKLGTMKICYAIMVAISLEAVLEIIGKVKQLLCKAINKNEQ